MKKIIALILAVVMVFGLVACAAAPETKETEAPKAEEAVAEEPAKEESNKEEAPVAEESGDALPYEGVKLSLWMPPWAGTTQEFWEGEMVKFKEKTGADVEFLFVPWGDCAVKYMSGFLSGEGPDVYYFNNELMYDTITAGNALELTPYFTDEEVADQLFWSAGTAMGGQYAAPLISCMGPRGFAYNMDLLEQAGVDALPNTYAEVLEAAKKIQAAGICEYPILFPTGDYVGTTLDTFLPLLWSAGGDMVSADGTEATLDSEECLTALNFMNGLKEEGVLSGDCNSVPFESSLELFTSGKVAIVTCEYARTKTSMLEANNPFEWAFNYGYSEDGENILTFGGGIDTVAVNPNSANVDASVELLKYLTSSEFRADIREFNPTYGLVKMNASDEDIVYDDEMDLMISQTFVDKTRQLPVCKGCQTIVESIFSNVQLMLMGEQTPDETAKAMQEAAAATLSD